MICFGQQWTAASNRASACEALRRIPWKCIQGSQYSAQCAILDSAAACSVVVAPIFAPSFSSMHVARAPACEAVLQYPGSHHMVYVHMHTDHTLVDLCINTLCPLLNVPDMVDQGSKSRQQQYQITRSLDRT